MIKTWTPIITAVLALLGTLAVAILQTGSASKDEVATIVSQINDKTLPYIQSRLDDLADRLSKLEGKLEIGTGALGRMLSRDSKMVYTGLPKPKPIPKLEQAE